MRLVGVVWLCLSLAAVSRNAVGSDGRLAVRVTAPDSWFWLAGVLDPLTGRVERVWPNVDADLTIGWAD